MKIARRVLVLPLFLAFSLLSHAQTLRGTVRDADNSDVIVGATVVLRFSLGAAAPILLATNPSGEFVFETIRAGYYSIEIIAQGFENQKIVEINVTAGKEQVLDIALRRTASELSEVIITATQTGRRTPLPLGEIPLTRDQTLRFPATFFDPARLAMAYPGVANTDDQANGLSIRGNSPSSVRWRLEGVDIVNPNHLTNAGTFSDRPAAASGGILMFSAQLLDNSSLLTGAFPAGCGDALGGIMDMNLRKGNNRQHEFTAQAGLIGLDLAAEGPIGNKRINSYLVNYRYSTVGLLGQLGVSFGDEQISFQDLSFNLNFQGKRGGRWSVFGLGGLSETIFKHKTDTTEIKAYKDLFDIDFESKTGVLGLSNWSRIWRNAWIKTTVAYSEQMNVRTSFSPSFSEISSSDDNKETKVSTAITLSQHLGRQFRMLVGVSGTLQKYKAASTVDAVLQATSRHKYLLNQPWVQFSWNSRNKSTLIDLGMHGLFFRGPYSYFDVPLNYAFSVEPRGSISQKLSENHRVSLAGGFYSQIPPQWLLSYETSLTSSKKISAAYSWQINEKWVLRTEIYQQWITHVSDSPGKSFSILNASEFQLEKFYGFSPMGSGRNKGIELSIERRLTDGWFLLANTSLSDSKYPRSSGVSDVWVSTRWDIGHIANVVFGKEWQREKSAGKERTIGLNFRAVLVGGTREPDLVLQNNTMIIEDANGYYRQYRDYFRVDVRVYWRKNLGNRRNSTFALDIQNLTGQQNFAYHYYDPHTEKIETKYQLGTIPNFNWRIEF
ncbi:MAG: carboxypeptidase regulatory-like domain-containing protein [Saprospiraceae bacterium]